MNSIDLITTAKDNNGITLTIYNIEGFWFVWLAGFVFVLFNTKRMGRPMVIF